jgi:hypothetical protein
VDVVVVRDVVAGVGYGTLKAGLFPMILILVLVLILV